jgi:hypothetical protein
MSYGEPTASETHMSIDEARAVMWLRNNHRPMGELLDEGFLTQARLEWAAEKAYDPHLKQAAAVLLEHIKGKSPVAETQTVTSPPLLDAGVTVEQARSTAWPFAPHKGKPMGPLVDSQELTLKDLGFAIENAWDERVRRAASVLAAIRINHAVKEPLPPAGPLNVISSGRSYAQRRETLLTLVQGLIMGALLMLSIGVLILTIPQMVRRRPDLSLAEILSMPTGIIVLTTLVVLSAGATLVFRVLPDLALKRLDAQIENYRRGQDGEDRVAESLSRHLDGQWTLFRNVRLPGRNKADLDMVLVGPPGPDRLIITYWQ